MQPCMDALVTAVLHQPNATNSHTESIFVQVPCSNSVRESALDVDKRTDYKHSSKDIPTIHAYIIKIRNVPPCMQLPCCKNVTSCKMGLQI